MRPCETFPWTCFTALVYFSQSAESWSQTWLTADPPGTDVILGENVTLTCRVTGSEGWKYIWTKRTKGVTTQLLGSSGQDGETYILQPVRKSDRGLYQCRGLRGSELSDSNSHSLRVHDVAQPVIRQNPPGPEWFSGETVTLECDIRGGSGWRYSWAKVTTQTRLQSLTPSSKGGKNYIVQSAKVSDSGEYICQAERGSEPGFQSQPASVYLSITGEKPEAVITWTSHEGETYTGERISLSCRVRGASSGWKYLWYKDRLGTELSNPDNSRTDGSSYTIISAALSHSGQYWCRAQRGSFYSQYSDPLQVDIHDLPQALLTLQPGWTDLFPTENVTLRCELPGDSTQWEYKWYRDGQELPADESDSSSVNEDTYIILSANLSHAGRYQCSGRPTRAAGFPPISNSILLSLYTTVPESLISHHNFSGDIYTGDRVTLSCVVEGGSVGWKYLWYKDRQGTELSNPDNSSTDGSSYTIISAALSHSGQYWCRAQRGSFYSQYSDPLQLDIHDLPQALLTLQPGWTDLFPTEGVTLRCELPGDSTQWEYKWYRDGQELPADESDSSRADRNIYRIHSAGPSHSGKYQCSGRPTRGTVNSPISNPITLTMNWEIPKPELSLDSSHGETYTGERISLSCRVRGASFGWKYLWHKDRQGTELSNPDNSSTDGSSYTIISAALSHSGQYWCRAQRGSFYSQYSDPLQLVIHAHPQAVLAVQSGIIQILTKDSLTLRCEVEGSSVGWNYTWYADGSQLHEDQDGQTFTVRSGNATFDREYKCRGNRTEKPFYSTISNGLVPNLIVLFHILVIFTSGFVLLSVITLTIVCLIRRRKSGQNKKMHDNELYVSSLGMERLNVGKRTTAIYEEIDDDPGKGHQEQFGSGLYSTLQIPH
ncbi:immunoglobulin superfamily member 1-like isoform X3 [Brienomyrus brachyistius]|uniref:immunoglobulin superfamily member 1-like isoform X3 n=1 Tax=Brienomyrus brachyistius TaxID=42636 RepID=UPI0020B24A6C|nr:immunoglobulin superfamily member 1-like isoform X3 [Brienomyrus brachyistius]